MTSISCDGIRLSFGAETILEDISFSLNEGDKLGIVGVNGAGKSSLFKIITGEYTADSGNCFISKDKHIGVLDQHLGLDQDKSVMEETLEIFSELIRQEAELEDLRNRIERGENALADRYAVLQDQFTHGGGYEFRGRCRGMLVRFGFDESYWNMPVCALSGGQKTRLALARLLLKEPDILMLDEPTNHLDTDTLFWLEDYLRSYRKTVLLISHDRYFLDRVTDKILEIEYGRSKLYHGNYTAYVTQKAADREIQERHYKNQQREIARIEAYIEQQRRWNRERNIIAAESREKQLAKMERVEKPADLPDSIRMRFTKSGESGNDVLTARGIYLGYPGKPLLDGADFLIKKRERVIITGPNGCGKSTLIKLLAGKSEPLRGILEFGYNVTIGYYDQENQNLNDDNTVLEELWSAYEGLTQTEIRSALALFLFKGDDIQKKVGVLSGGERARLTLTKLILSRMNLLILDEPTNHLDINSREALEKALLDFDGTIIAVSHDRYFMDKLATRIFAFNVERERSLCDFRGSYSEFLTYRKAFEASAPGVEEQIPISASKERYLETKRSNAEQRRYERRVRLTRESIAETEAAIEKIDEEMNGEAAVDYPRLAELYEKKQAMEEKLMQLYEEWEELSPEE